MKRSLCLTQKLTKIIFLIFLSHYTLTANLSIEAVNLMSELNDKNNEYYSGERIVDTSEAKNILEKIKNSSSVTDDEKMFLSIEGYTLWANTSIASGTLKEDYPILKNIYENIKKDKSFKKGNSDVYASFSDFASAMIPLAMFNGKSYWYVFVVDGYDYARIALIKNPENIKASVLYGMGSSIPVNYLANNQYSKSLKLMGYTEGLEDYMIFRTYIYKSMLYMKVNETELAFEELAKAENMYPNAMFVYMLKASYAKGGTGFASPEGI